MKIVFKKKTIGKDWNFSNLEINFRMTSSRKLRTWGHAHTHARARARYFYTVHKYVYVCEGLIRINGRLREPAFNLFLFFKKEFLIDCNYSGLAGLWTPTGRKSKVAD